MVTAPGCALPGALESIGTRRPHVLMKLELAPIFHRILALHKCRVRRVEPIVEAGKQKAQRRASGKKRQRLKLLRRKLPDGVIAIEQRAGLGHVEGAVGLKTPSVQANGQVVGEQVVAGEIKVDHPRYLIVQKEDVI